MPSLGDIFAIPLADDLFIICPTHRRKARNLSVSATATASDETKNSPPAQAIDQDTETAWNAGDSPPEWILIDLGESCVVESVRLLVNQSPDGDTVHDLDLGATEDLLAAVHTFSGRTTDQQWLEYVVPSQISDHAQESRRTDLTLIGPARTASGFTMVIPPIY